MATCPHGYSSDLWCPVCIQSKKAPTTTKPKDGRRLQSPLVPPIGGADDALANGVASKWTNGDVDVFQRRTATASLHLLAFASDNDWHTQSAAQCAAVFLSNVAANASKISTPGGGITKYPEGYDLFRWSDGVPKYKAPNRTEAYVVDDVLQTLNPSIDMHGTFNRRRLAESSAAVHNAHTQCHRWVFPFVGTSLKTRMRCNVCATQMDKGEQAWGFPHGGKVPSDSIGTNGRPRYDYLCTMCTYVVVGGAFAQNPTGMRGRVNARDYSSFDIWGEEFPPATVWPMILNCIIGAGPYILPPMVNKDSDTGNAWVKAMLDGLQRRMATALPMWPVTVNFTVGDAHGYPTITTN